MHQHRGVSGHLSVHENSLRDDGWMLGEGGNAHREELLQHPAVVFLQRDLVSLHGVHSDEVGMLLIPLSVRDALQQHQNEFQTPGRRAEMLGSGKLLPSFQPGVSKHPKNPQSQQRIPLAEVVPVCASREGLDGVPRAGHGAQERIEPPGEGLRAELGRARCGPMDPPGTAGS